MELCEPWFTFSPGSHFSMVHVNHGSHNGQAPCFLNFPRGIKICFEEFIPRGVFFSRGLKYLLEVIYPRG